jgi:hypothetical protein
LLQCIKALHDHVGQAQEEIQACSDQISALIELRATRQLEVQKMAYSIDRIARAQTVIVLHSIFPHSINIQDAFGQSSAYPGS